MTPRNRPVPGPSRILIVCSGNLCRSPMAAAMITHALAGVPVCVDSAGTLAREGAPMAPAAAAELARRGIPVDGFRSRRLTDGLVTDADLVLTAERTHRAAVVTLVPTASARTFTLGEIARLLEDAPPAGGLTPAELARTAAFRRGRSRPARDNEDDLDDPYRRRASAYARCATTLEQLLDPVIRRLVVADVARVG